MNWTIKHALHDALIRFKWALIFLVSVTSAAGWLIYRLPPALRSRQERVSYNTDNTKAVLAVPTWLLEFAFPPIMLCFMQQIPLIVQLRRLPRATSHVEG
jgi:hypothetical protein